MQAIRDKAMQDYRKKLVEHREVESRLNEMQDNLKDLMKQYNNSENDLKPLQSIGQIVGEVLKPLLYNMSHEDLGDVTYNVISGLSEQIRELEEVIELPLLNPELFQRVGITSPKGLFARLLYDPLGTGKTLLARAVASQLDANFLKVVSSTIVDKYIGEDDVDNSEYRYEIARLQSYQNWPVPHIIEPKRLAAAGFYYTGEGDKVKCFECHVEICQWVEGDNAMVDHQRWSARCRFIRKINCGNVPIGVDPNTGLPPRPRSRNVYGPYGVDYKPTSGPDNHNFTSELRLPSTAKLSCLDVGRAKGPVHPEYASHDARLQTFEKWPRNMAQTKEELADAGFYFTGKNDETLCYYCGGGLKDWELEDEPWEQHAKWFSKCYYLLMVKGQNYVNKVTGQHISPPSKEELMQMNLPSFIKKVQPVLMSIEMKEDAESNPGSQSSSANSGIESIGSVRESVKGSIEDLCNANTQNNKPIEDGRMCKICYNEELGVLFSPCGHLVACVKCAPAMTICGVCREPVTEKVRAFVS